MSHPKPPLGALLDRIVRECVEEGNPVVLSGLGTFHSSADGDLEFTPTGGVRIFIGYVSENQESAIKLFENFTKAGLSPWVDVRKLLPGQNWRRCIEHAIDNADFFVPCFSRRAAAKRGFFPYELRYALRCEERMPLDDCFIMPVRLEDCDVPHRFEENIQHVDLLPDWDAGFSKLLLAVREEVQARLDRKAA